MSTWLECSVHTDIAIVPQFHNLHETNSLQVTSISLLEFQAEMRQIQLNPTESEQAPPGSSKQDVVYFVAENDKRSRSVCKIGLSPQDVLA